MGQGELLPLQAMMALISCFLLHEEHGSQNALPVQRWAVGPGFHVECTATDSCENQWTVYICQKACFSPKSCRITLIKTFVKVILLSDNRSII